MTEPPPGDRWRALDAWLDRQWERWGRRLLILLGLGWSVFVLWQLWGAR